MQDNIPVIAIVGPTAVGKTALSIELAKSFNGEVINGDSMQVYKGLDIGTGKITKEETEGIKHHLFDIVDVREDYNASQFQKEARDKIKEITSNNKLPIIVGGSGLYIEGLLYEMTFGGVGSRNVEVRRRLEEEAEEIGEKALWDKLEEIDPQAASKIPFQNVRRTIRALEVIETTGELFSSQKRSMKPYFNELVIVLDRPRDKLYDRINLRVELMIEQGLEEEARWLYNELEEDSTYQSARGIGYKEWWPYFKEETNIDAVIQSIQQNSRRYAKRQLTWFRNRLEKKVIIDIQDEASAIKEASEIVNEFLKDVVG